MRCALKPPLSMRHVTDDERAALAAGRRSAAAFTVRRCQRWLASAERQPPARLAKSWRGAPQTVRHVRHAFDARGLACVPRGSNVPLTGEPVLHAETREQVRAMLHQSPRTFGPPARGWTLQRLADVCHEQGLRDTTLSGPTRLEAIVRVGINGPRAKPWIVSPDPASESKQPPRPTDTDGRQPSGPGVGLRS